MHYALMAGARGEINTFEFGRIFDLISDVETAGTTHSLELVKEPFYLQAIEDWKAVPERRLRARLIPQIHKLLKLALLARIKEVKNEQNVRDRFPG